MTWRSLLVPTDFGVAAQRARDLAIDMARAQGARVVLLHVASIPHGVAPTTKILPDVDDAQPVSVAEHVRGAGLRALERDAAAARKRGVAVEVRAEIGDVSDVVLDVARELGCDAIVMGTHGRRGLAHVFLGSVAEKVIRRADVPVVTVRASDEADARLTEERALEDEAVG